MISKKVVFIFWGWLDVVYILLYSMSSFLKGNIPFYSDIVSAINVFNSHGGVESIVLFFINFMLHVSIFSTAILFFAGDSRIKVFCYIQTPVRFLLLVPSIPFLMVFPGLFSGIFSVFMFVLISEVIKLYTLNKFRG